MSARRRADTALDRAAEGNAVMPHIKTAYIDSEAVVRKGRYADGSTALVLDDPQNGEWLAKATVCMQAYGEMPRSGRHVFVKDYGENEGMYEALKTAGIVGDHLRVLDAGHAVGGVYECPVTDLDAIGEL